MIHLIRYSTIAVLSWGLGVGTYLGSLYVFFGQTIKWGGDLQSVLLWSFIALMAAIPTIYFPSLVALRNSLKGFKPLIAFPLLGTLLGAAPTGFIIFRWGGGIRDLWSSEAFLFYCMFAAVGTTLGLGFVWCQKNKTGTGE